MSWASRRKTLYVGSVIVFFAVLIGVPVAYWYFSVPATCADGIQNQGETAVDEGGPCPRLDARALQPESVLWARSFRVRDGSYNAVAYVENPNMNGGVRAAQYRFSLYDSQNVLIAERTGTTYLMPGTITPVFEGGIDAGNRIVAHTYFELAQPLVWERLRDTSTAITIDNKTLANASAEPRIAADAANASVADIAQPEFVAVVFDTAGNAIAASRTALPQLAAGASAHVVFTWPEPFSATVGRIDITPLTPPAP